MKTALQLAALGVGAWCLYRVLRRPDYAFAGKRVFITGGSRGLGLVLAREVLERGGHVAICARDSEELHLASDDLRGRGGNVFTVECDVTSQEQVQASIARIEREFGPIDVLVNNAGIIGVGPLETMELEDFERTMQTHFWASLYTVLAVLPSMRARGQGRIVNISSIGGKIALPHLVPYTASKFALVGLSAGLRTELAREGIVVTTVCPGLMRTGSHLNAEFKGQHDREYAWFALGNSLPGMSISAESSAASILDACARGDAELVLSLPARLAVALQALMPNVLADLAGLVNQWLLPAPGNGDREAVPGHVLRGALPGYVTTLTDRAAEQNNELHAATV